MQDIMATTPTMVCMGNHEGMYDALNYRSRFSMPNYEETESMYFSFNVGNTHWISYDTEVGHAFGTPPPNSTLCRRRRRRRHHSGSHHHAASFRHFRRPYHH